MSSFQAFCYVFNLFLVFLIFTSTFARCPNNCSGHGKCQGGDGICDCYSGWGSVTDIAEYKTLDCSAKTCPNGLSWAHLPGIDGNAHKYTKECSGKGICDRSMGTCTCQGGFAGAACERKPCPNDCSGHGVCVSMRMMARYTLNNAFPLTLNNVSYGDVINATLPWEHDKIFGCVCDSSWEVGLKWGQTQTTEWFGPDCSLRHCPSGNDPRTAANETDCFNITMNTDGVNANGGAGLGLEGNLCHVDCANRGICDYNTGQCKCFKHFGGPDCTITSAFIGTTYGSDGNIIGAYETGFSSLSNARSGAGAGYGPSGGSRLDSFLSDLGIPNPG